MLPPSSVGSPPTLFGTASRIYQGSEVIDPPPPQKPPLYNQKLTKEIPSRSTTSLGIPIVRPSAPVGVVQAEGLPGGGQKPMSAKAEIEAARNTSSNVSLRVMVSPYSFPSQR